MEKCLFFGVSLGERFFGPNLSERDPQGLFNSDMGDLIFHGSCYFIRFLFIFQSFTTYLYYNYDPAPPSRGAFWRHIKRTMKNPLAWEVLAIAAFPERVLTTHGHALKAPPICSLEHLRKRRRQLRGLASEHRKSLGFALDSTRKPIEKAKKSSPRSIFRANSFKKITGKTKKTRGFGV